MQAGEATYQLSCEPNIPLFRTSNVGVVAHTSNLSTWEVKKEDWKLKTSLTYAINLRLAWAI